MIPVHIDLKQVPKWTVTISLIAINFLVFLYSYSLDFSGFVLFVNEYGFIPASPSYITLLTHMFVHAGLLHLLGNMAYLWLFGAAVETRIGGAWYLVFYIMGGFAAAAMHALVVTSFPGIPLVGASGAISTLLGMALALFPRAHIIFWYIIRAKGIYFACIWFLLFWFLLQFLSGLSDLQGTASGVGFWAHIGGFLFGFIFALLFRIIGIFKYQPAGNQIYESIATAGTFNTAGGSTGQIAKEEFLPELNSDVTDSALEKELLEGNWKTALRDYREFIHEHPEQVLSAEAEWTAAGHLMNIKRWVDARDAFLRLAGSHPESDYAPHALCTAATIEYKYLKNFRRGLYLWRMTKCGWPGSKAAEEADSSIADIREKLVTKTVFSRKRGFPVRKPDNFTVIWNQVPPDDPTATAMVISKQLGLPIKEIKASLIFQHGIILSGIKRKKAKTIVYAMENIGLAALAVQEHEIAVLPDIQQVLMVTPEPTGWKFKTDSGNYILSEMSFLSLFLANVKYKQKKKVSTRDTKSQYYQPKFTAGAAAIDDETGPEEEPAVNGELKDRWLLDFTTLWPSRRLRIDPSVCNLKWFNDGDEEKLILDVYKSIIKSAGAFADNMAVNGAARALVLDNQVPEKYIFHDNDNLDRYELWVLQLVSWGIDEPVS